MPLQNNFESSIKNLTVDLADFGRYQSTVTVMQGDSGTRFVKVKVLNDGHPVDLTNTYPVLRGTKRDETTIFNKCSIIDNCVYAELTPNILSVAGMGRYEIALYDSDVEPEEEEEEETGYVAPNGITYRYKINTLNYDGADAFNTQITIYSNYRVCLCKTLYSQSQSDYSYAVGQMFSDGIVRLCSIASVMGQHALTTVPYTDTPLPTGVTNVDSIVGYIYGDEEADLFNNWTFDIDPTLAEQYAPEAGLPIYNTTEEALAYSDDPEPSPSPTPTQAKVISAFPFNINVVKSSFDAQNMVTSNEWTVLNEAISNIEKMQQLDEFEQMVEDMEDEVTGLGEDIDELANTVASHTISIQTLEQNLGGHTVGIDVPSDAVFTDTTYSNATTSSDGLMSSADKTKLNTIANGAEVNQNAFKTVAGTGGSVTAGAKEDVLNLAGDNIGITFDQSTKTITFSAEGGGGGGTDYAKHYEGTPNDVDYAFFKIIPDDFPYSDTTPDEMKMSLTTEDLLSKNDWISNYFLPASYFESDGICFTRKDFTASATSTHEHTYSVHVDNKHLCPYNNTTYNHYYYVYKTGTGYKYQIWSNYGRIAYNSSDKKIYIISSEFQYEADLGNTNYPDAVLYDMYGNRYTTNTGWLDIDNGTMFIYDPSDSDAMTGLNELYDFYYDHAEDGNATFNLIVDFKTGLSYDYYYFIPYYYSGLSYMLADQEDKDGNTVHAEYETHNGHNVTPSTGDQVLVKCNYFTGLPITLYVDQYGSDPHTYTSDFLNEFMIYSDKETLRNQAFYDDASYIHEMNLDFLVSMDYQTFDPAKYVSKIEEEQDLSPIRERISTPEVIETNSNPVSMNVQYDQILSDFKVEFYPHQNMNGYDVPNYQGNGRNKLHLTHFSGKTINGVTISIDSDGVITLSGTSTAYTTVELSTLVNDGLTAGVKYCYSGVPTQSSRGGSNPSVRLTLTGNNIDPYVYGYDDEGFGMNPDYAIDSDTKLNLIIFKNSDVTGMVIKPMAVVQDTDTHWHYKDFVPWDNECPIYERSSYTIYNVQKSFDSLQTGSLSYYGGYKEHNCGLLINISTKKAYLWKYISSYAGETLPDIWISSRDEYSEGGTPTTGAMVAYLDTANEIDITYDGSISDNFDWVPTGYTVYYVGCHNYSDDNYPAEDGYVDGRYVSNIAEYCKITSNYYSGFFATIQMLEDHVPDLSAYATKTYVDNAINTAIISALNGSY